MKQIDLGKIKYNFKKGNQIDETLLEALSYCENSYLNFFLENIQLNYISFLEMDESYTAKDEFAFEMYKEIADILSDSSSLFDCEKYNYTDRIDKLKTLKDKAKKRLKTLLSYNDELAVYELILERLEYKFDDLRVYKQKITDEDFAGNVIQYIFKDENNAIINDKVKSIYEKLPINFSKNIFYNISDASLERLVGVDKNSFENYIVNLKETFAPSSVEGYEEYFPEIVNSLKKFAEIDEKYMDSSQLEAFLDLEEVTTICIEELSTTYMMLIEMMNRILGILMIMEDGQVDTFSKNIILFNEMFEHLGNSKDAEDIMTEKVIDLLHKLEDRFVETTESNFESNMLIDHFNLSFSEQISSMKLDGRVNNLMKLKALASASLFDDAMLPCDELMDARTLALAKNDLVHHYKETTKGMPRLIEKSKYAYMLSVLNIVHTSPQEIHQFILDVLKGCKNEGDREASKAIILEIIDGDNIY